MSFLPYLIGGFLAGMTFILLAYGPLIVDALGRQRSGSVPKLRALRFGIYLCSEDCPMRAAGPSGLCRSRTCIKKLPRGEDMR